MTLAWEIHNVRKKLQKSSLMMAGFLSHTMMIYLVKKVSIQIVVQPRLDEVIVDLSKYLVHNVEKETFLKMAQSRTLYCLFSTYSHFIFKNTN